MADEKIKKLSALLKVDYYNQTLLSDSGLYKAYVQTNLFDQLCEQIKSATNLPLTKWETFNTRTWENEHHVNMYIVSEDIINEYVQMKEEKLLR